MNNKKVKHCFLKKSISNNIHAWYQNFLDGFKNFIDGDKIHSLRVRAAKEF